MRLNELTDIQKGQLFKKLASSSVMEVGREFGLDKSYSTPASVRGIVGKARMEVLENPDKFGVSQEVVDVVLNALETRKNKGNEKPEVTLHDKEHAIEKMDIKDLTTRGSKSAMLAMNKKLDAIHKSKKALKDVPLGTMAQVTGILFDKARIVAGEATEHIALKAKISKDLTAAEKLDMIMKMREQTTTVDGD